MEKNKSSKYFSTKNALRHRKMKTITMSESTQWQLDELTKHLHLTNSGVVEEAIDMLFQARFGSQKTEKPEEK